MSIASSSLRVLLADDHVVIREGLRSILERTGIEVVCECSDGHEAVRQSEALHPDVAVLDIAMPLLNGIDAARALMRSCPATKVVLLTMYADEQYVLASLRAGVAGYVLKSNAASHLLQAIESVSRGETYLSPGVSGTVVHAFLSNAEATTDPLSPRERQVLQLIAEGRNMKEIGGLLGISGRTAETHRARIMTKLNIHDVPGLVRYAMRNGLVGAENALRRADPLPEPSTPAATWPTAVPKDGVAGSGPRPAA